MKMNPVSRTLSNGKTFFPTPVDFVRGIVREADYDSLVAIKNDGEGNPLIVGRLQSVRLDVTAQDLGLVVSYEVTHTAHQVGRRLNGQIVTQRFVLMTNKEMGIKSDTAAEVAEIRGN